MSDERERKRRLRPRWFVRLAWSTHRSVYSVAGGRVGLWRPTANRWVTMHLTTTGHRTGQAGSVILGYLQDAAIWSRWR